MENKNSNRAYLIALVSLAALLVLVSIMYYASHRENQSFIKEISAEKQNLEQELVSLSADYDSLQTNNDTLNVKLKMEQEKISDLLNKMRTFRNNSYAEINLYKREIKSLKSVLRDYVVQIDSLNTSNRLLRTENQQVKRQISEVKQRNQQLEKKAENLKEVVDIASVLRIEGLRSEALNSKGKEVNKLRKVAKLRTSFRIIKNLAASTGAKTVYVRITRPDGLVLGNYENGVFKFENTELTYSAKRVVDYEGEALEVAVYWDSDGSIVLGDYRVDVFLEGNLAGTTNFSIK